MQIQNKRTIISCGRPGVGKSSLGNSLLFANPHYPYGFKSCSDPTQFGITKEVQILQKYVPSYGTTLQYIDIPGSGDHTVNMTTLGQSLSNQLARETIHAMLFLVAVQDNRLTTNEIQAINFIKSFFKPTNGRDAKDSLWLIITHCGEIKPTYQFIQAKLTAFEKFGLSISKDHVVEYSFDLIKLQPFIQKVIKVPTSYVFVSKPDYQSSLNNYYQSSQKTKSIDLVRVEREQQQNRLQRMTKQLQEVRKNQQLQTLQVLDTEIEILINKKQTCPKKHLLKFRPYSRSSYLTFFCDVCDYQITQHREGAFSCRLCNFEKCINCFINELFKTFFIGLELVLHKAHHLLLQQQS